jgi:hypothetical protein
MDGVHLSLEPCDKCPPTELGRELTFTQLNMTGSRQSLAVRSEQGSHKPRKSSTVAGDLTRGEPTTVPVVDGARIRFQSIVMTLRTFIPGMVLRAVGRRGVKKGGISLALSVVSTMTASTAPGGAFVAPHCRGTLLVGEAAKGASPAQRETMRRTSVEGTA